MTGRGIRISALALAPFVLIRPANAQQPDLSLSFLKGNALYEKCTGQVQADKMFCLGYIDGVVEIFFGTKHGPPCPPAGISDQQVKDVVINYLKAHPEKRNYTAATTVVVAVGDAWRCLRERPR